MEWLSRGEASTPTQGHVLCRHCSRVSDTQDNAIASGWERFGIKINMPLTADTKGFYWAQCWSCLGKVGIS